MKIETIVAAVSLACGVVAAAKDIYALVLRSLRSRRERVVLTAHATCRATATATPS